MIQGISKYTIEYSDQDFCYVIRSRDPATSIKNLAHLNVSAVLRLLLNQVKLDYREIATFCNLGRPNEIFRLAYLQRNEKDANTLNTLVKYLVIDISGGTAKFYRHDHKPDSVEIQHIPVSIHSNEAKLTITERVPVKVTTRVTVNDPLRRNIVMNIVPKGGYLLGLGDVSLCSPGVPYTVTGTASALNDLLRRIHFVGTEVGEGSVAITTNDLADKDNSVATVTVNLTIQAGVKVSIPKINVPDSVSVVLNKSTKISPAITVSDDDNKLVSLRIYPYNCEVYGWKSLAGYISTGEYHASTGRPETINADIAELSVRARKSNAQLGLEILCGKSIIRDHLCFTVTEEDGGDDGDDEEVVSKDPELTAKNITGTQNTQVALGASFSTDGVTEPVAVTITAVDCRIVNYNGGAIEANTPKKDTAPVADINSRLAAAKVAIGTSSGSIKFDWGTGKTKTITVTATPPASKVPELTVSNLQGEASAVVPLGASFSTDGVTADQKVTITPSGCTFQGFEGHTSGSNVVLSGKIAKVNELLGKGKVVVGASSGNISFSWNDGKKTKQITVTTNPSGPRE